MPHVGEIRVDLDAMKSKVSEAEQRKRDHEEAIAAEETLIEKLNAAINLALEFQITSEVNIFEDDDEVDVFTGKSQPEIAVFILREHGGPMRARDVADAMVLGGYETDDESRLRNAVFTSMDRRKDLFYKPEPGLWDLVDRRDNDEPGYGHEIDPERLANRKVLSSDQ